MLRRGKATDSLAPSARLEAVFAGRSDKADGRWGWHDGPDRGADADGSSACLGSVLAVVALDALHEIFGLAGFRYSNLLDSYFYDAVATGAWILMVVHGLGRETDSGWVVLGLGTFSWVVGDVLSDFSVGIGNGVSVSDAFWVAWYPLAVLGLFMLVHERFRQFDFARWIDGIALALVVATPGLPSRCNPPSTSPT